MADMTDLDDNPRLNAPRPHKIAAICFKQARDTVFINFSASAFRLRGQMPELSGEQLMLMMKWRLIARPVE